MGADGEGADTGGLLVSCDDRLTREVIQRRESGMVGRGGARGEKERKFVVWGLVVMEGEEDEDGRWMSGRR